MPSSGQIQLPFEPAPPPTKLEVLDLFTGIGGLSIGFGASGFGVTGVDHEPITERTFVTNNLGTAVLRDLSKEMVIRAVPVVIGGPPCRPWSAINTQRRGVAHADHALLERFFLHVFEIRPEVFVMENVPPIVGDPEYHRLVKEMQWRGYSVAARVLRYSDFGASTRRRRLFTVGFRDSVRRTAEEFFGKLSERHRPPSSVRHAIEWLRDQPRGSVTDHEWSNVRTISKYQERYRTGQYGWRQLEWDVAAPSFGSVSKTYILHPAAGEDGFPLRVISVREVLSLMGFSRSFRFPDGTPLGKRYRMAANAVSPMVAEACADTIREMLTGHTREE